MRVSIDAVVESGKVAETAICYTGDLFDPDRAKYDLKYYVGLAKELEAAGAHILAIKDMAGLLKPAAAKKLIETLKQEISLPIHLHTHDTSGASAATVLAAVDAGVDVVDAAMDALSGTTSQPTLGSLVAALEGGPRDPELDLKAIREISFYWEAVRTQYRAFESDLRSGASEVYLHEMPGGQFTNLKEQARSLGLEIALARGRPHLCRRQPDVRRHREGDAVVKGRRRHGAGDGLVRPDPRRRRGPDARSRVPGFGGRLLRRRARPAAGRLPQGAAEEGAQGQGADDQAARLLPQGRRPRGRARQGRRGRRGHGDRRSPPRLLPHVPKSVFATSPRRRTATARPRCCRRRSISTA